MLDLKRCISKPNVVLKDFLSSTSIHGLCYMSSRPWYERLSWAFIISTSIWVCCGHTYEVYFRWQTNPILINYNQQLSSVSDLPFPAITLCFPLQLTLNIPRSRSHTDERNITFDQLAELVKHDFVGEEDIELFAVHIPLLPKNLQQPYWTAFNSNPENLSMPEEFYPIENDFYANCKDSRFEESWECDFKRIFTKYGYCQTFNMLNRSELFHEDVFVDYHGTSSPIRGWSKEFGYTAPKGTSRYWDQEYPGRTAFGMRDLEIFFNFYKYVGHSFNATKYFDKIQIFLHNPYDYPWNHETITLKSDSLTDIYVEPKMIIADESLKEMFTPEQRKCYFDGERQLKYFKIYSESNCELECLSNISAHFCNCVSHWMPRTAGWNVCGQQEMNCSKAQIYYYFDIEQNAVFEDKEEYEWCNCLPECNSVKYMGTINNVDELAHHGKNKTIDSYVAKTFLENWRGRKKEISYILKDKNDSWNLTRVEFSVRCRDSMFLPLKRSPMYTYTDFVSDCGGLFGLFMGMSVISFIELIYFFTIRLLNN